MTLEERINYCLNWFEENQVEIPKTARDWSRQRAGIGVPPRHTYQALRPQGIRVGELLEHLLPGYVNRVKNPSTDCSWLPSLGLHFIARTGVESIKYLCTGCGVEHTSLLGTLRRWKDSGKLLCSICRVASGKVKDVPYYQSFLDIEYFKILSIKDMRVSIKCRSCDYVFTRARSYLAGSDRSHSTLVECPNCTRSKVFVYDKGEYTSLKEKECVEHLESLGVEMEREVLYSKLLNTARKYRLDVWLPAQGIGIEITTSNNNLPGYQSNLADKIKLARDQGVKIFTATSKRDIEDIVRTFSES